MKRRRTSAKDTHGERSWWCYILVSERDESHTYTGKTSDYKRRLRQHNGELAGDSRSTQRYRPWRTLILISGFTSNASAAQVEYALKTSRSPRSKGITNRIRSLIKVLQQERPTKKAPLFSERNMLTIDIHISRTEFLRHAGIAEMPIIPHASFSFMNSANDHAKTTP